MCYVLHMPEAWDTIVIGSGIGGLTAAAHLVQAGLRALVLERNPHPGGTAYVYHRKGFTFPMGPLGFSSLKLIQETLDGLNIGDHLDFSRVHYRIRAFDLDLPISLPFNDMVDKLTRIFPADAEAVYQFFKEMEAILSGQHAPDPDAHSLRPGCSSDISASEYLHGRIKDWRLRRILGSMGTREPYSNLFLLAAMWNLMCREGIWHPREGMESFCTRLVEAVSGSGKIRLGKEVDRIRLDKGTVEGVTLRDGTRIDSASIISNADFKNTFLKLIGPEVLPPKWQRALSEARQTGSIIQVCIGVGGGKVDLSAFEDARRLIYRRNLNGFKEKEGNPDVEEIDPEVLSSQELEVSLWGKMDRLTSTGRGAAIVIRTEAEHRHFSKFRSSSGRRIPGYREYKIRLSHALIREIEHLLPGLKKAISVTDVATPLTFEDQGGRSEGTVAGWSWDYGDFRANQSKELILTPFKGLYMAGYQAFSALFLGGVPTAMESGRRAAKAVLEGAGPADEILIPGITS